MATPYTPPPGYRIVDVHVDETTPWGNLSHRRVERIDATAPHHLRLMAEPQARIRERRELLAGMALAGIAILSAGIVYVLFLFLLAGASI